MEQGIIILDRAYLNAFGKRLDAVKRSIENIIKNHHIPLDDEYFMSEKEACGRLRTSRSALYNLRSRGILPYIQLSGKIIYRERDIQKILEENYVQSVKDFIL